MRWNASVLFATGLVTALVCAMPAAADPPRTANAATQEAGMLGAAPYRIDIPAQWNGDLVVLAHGFEPAGVPRPSPWPQNEATPVFLAAGYAVAQSGYSTQGWALRDAIVDTQRLREHFASTHGAARHTYLVGFSMGGGVAIASLERQPERYDGALSLCGANLPGTHLAQSLFTTLVAFDHFFPKVEGLPGGLSDPAAPTLGQMQVMQAVAGALPTRPEVVPILARQLQVPAEALPGITSLHYLVFRDLVQRAGAMPVDNRDTVYAGFGDDAAFNASARRYPGDAAAMQYVATAPALTGQSGRPLVIQYNHDDPTIVPRFQPVYADLARATSPAPVTLPPVGEGHCGFSAGQIGEAFKVLTDWVETGTRPAVQ